MIAAHRIIKVGTDHGHKRPSSDTSVRFFFCTRRYKDDGDGENGTRMLNR